jgi:hypothetical protein
MKSQLRELSNEAKQHLLQVWKQDYAKALIAALQPTGDFLQIGCMPGELESQKRYQTKSHTLIECDLQKGQAAQEWAKKEPNRSYLPGTWNSELPKLGKFNTILYFDYQGIDDTLTLNYLFADEIIDEVAKAKKYLRQLADEMAQISVQYSSQQLEEFYQKVGCHHKDKMNQFFRNLMVNKNITIQQYDDLIAKFGLENVQPKDELFLMDKPRSMLECLQECLANHMSVGSRFVAFSNDISSHYEDAQFFDRIISNTQLDYQEKLVPIAIEGRNYDALVLLIEKKS